MLLAISLLAVMLALASCELGGKTAAAKTPPVPTAVVAPPPPAPPTPISSPQTEIQLPPEQPVSQEALATIQVAPIEPKPPEAPQPEPPAKPTTRRNAPAPQPKPETPAPAVADVPAPPPPAVQAPTEEPSRLQPVFTEEERRRILAEIEKRRGEIEGILHGVSQRRLSVSKRNVVTRIRSFMEVADDAARRGDLRSADSLWQRALILAQELASGR